MENIPPFMLFFDATLKELADRRPTDEEQLLAVKGVGAAKAGRYGQALLGIIAPFAGNDSSGSGAAAGSGNGNGSEGMAGEYRRSASAEVRMSDASAAGDEQPSHLVTLELFNAGQEVEEIASSRGFSKVTIEGHIIRAADEGHELDWSRIIPDGQEELIAAAIHEVGIEKLRPIKDALPEEVTYFAIHGVISKHGLKSS